VRYLPRLLLHRAVWIPIALSAASVLLFAVTGPSNGIALFAFNTFALPPALAAVFITGFFVPRASYLAGAIVATVATLFFCAFLLVRQQGVIPDLPPVDPALVPVEIASAFSLGPISGLGFGAAAAWYRRFLYLSSPARGQARGGSSPGRRSRSTTSRSSPRR
jgi:hypothetical protein